ncbi:sulfotransferase family protein [Halobacteroides halobius DSM 5150]|uniref:Sulfotransferase family protein n=1 Tax=Halobacteroides halobius (strain ATCC 35273 / DSM 5150 / MD-1) TaxID=748449 RepID=L0KCL6_HALHC|nr:sulfotransferase [Halobacteroides halobius]AGB42134.1 sulfotransferase family protein [Halobacteroides halobius DSM 5150]
MSVGKYDYRGSARQIAFIVGTGRCGTTILSKVLNAHSKICIPHELQIICGIGNGDRLYEKYIKNEFMNYTADDFIRLINKSCPYYFEDFFDYYHHFKELHYPQTDLRKLLKDLFDHICYSYDKEIFIEQTPWYGQCLDVLKELFPKMKVIHMVRDGRDVALSFVKTPWWSNDINENLLQWEKEVNKIHGFGLNNDEIFLEIRYEDLILNPEIELEKITNFLEVSFERNIMNPKELIDYSKLFKNNIKNHTSKEYKKWDKKKDNVFFKESVYSWKSNLGVNFNNIPVKVKESLVKLGYEI